MIYAIWIDEKALFNLGRGTVIERLVKQLENVAIGIPEYLVDQLPPLKCHKYSYPVKKNCIVGYTPTLKERR